MTYLQDGAYDATLISAHHGLSRNGKPLVEFLWRLDEVDKTIKSFLHLTTRTGEPNAKGIELTRRWATDWAGTDPDWFQENLATCQGYPVRLTIVNEPSLADPSRIFSQVKWINRRDRWEESRSKNEELGMKNDEVRRRAIDPAKVAAVPEGIAMTMKGVWSAFCFATDDWTGPEREALWLKIVSEIGAEKLQIDFTEEDWGRVWGEVRSEK